MFIEFPYFTIGLSYLFFRVIHLLIEGADGSGKRYPSPGACLLYTLNYTTLISGPIQRYNEFAREQFASEPLDLGLRVVGARLERIIPGFFKVNVLAMLLLSVQDGALQELQHSFPSSKRVLLALLLVVLYPFFVFKFFGIHRHCCRCSAAHAGSPSGELRPFILSFLISEFLESMAHHPVDLA
jgi:D-alanyl-lipoteichoic acid acyltransferase DltB (MBOAT superfamily)